MDMFNYTEDTIRVTEYKLAGKLPNPFIFEDGSVVKDGADWEERRKEVLKTAVDLQYGEMPPAPEFI